VGRDRQESDGPKDERIWNDRVNLHKERQGLRGKLNGVARWRERRYKTTDGSAQHSGRVSGAAVPGKSRIGMDCTRIRHRSLGAQCTKVTKEPTLRNSAKSLRNLGTWRVCPEGRIAGSRSARLFNKNTTSSKFERRNIGGDDCSMPRSR